MPVPLSRTRKRASHVNRSCSQVRNAASSSGGVGLPGSCNFYNVGGIYSIGARSKSVRQAIKKRTQICCNCEGVNNNGDISRRRTSAESCNPRTNNLEEYIATNEDVSTAFVDVDNTTTPEVSEDPI